MKAMTSRGPTLRAAGGPLAAVVALVGISVLRFVFPDTQGIMLFAVVPITLLGIMRGVRAGLVAAVLASAVSITWALTSGHDQALRYLGEVLTFFILGWLSGYFARGALGDFDYEQARTSSHLRDAIRRGRVVFHYQPIVRPDGEVIAVEALARWQDPNKGQIQPLDFIPAAESDDRTIW